MKRLTIIYFSVIGLILMSNDQMLSQEISESREAILMPGGYQIQGTARLEKLAGSGDLILRLSEDYSTPSGPDVQIYLTNHMTNIAGGHFVEDIGTGGTNHFNGAKSWNLGSSIDINDYDYIVFRCVQFGLHWAGGQFSGGDGVQEKCFNSAVFSTGTISEVSICTSDGEPDVVPFSNSLNLSAGPNYAYVVTDEDDNMIELVMHNIYNFEGKGEHNFRVYGVSYNSMLTFEPGLKIDQLNADSCLILSNNPAFISILNNDCPDVSTNCEETIVATTNWVSEVNICPNDGIDDDVELLNNRMIEAGDTYAFILTDTLRNIQQVVRQGSYNFEGSGLETQFVFGISYQGNLSVEIGQHISTLTASECYELSDTSLFLTIRKDNCAPTTMCDSSTIVATTNWVSEVTVCPTDGNDDFVPILNNKGIVDFDTYAFLITDVNRNLIAVVRDSVFNFEGSGTETNFVFGISFEGNLSTEIGQHISTISATDCFALSDTTLFLTVLKGNCAFECVSSSVTTSNGSNEVDLCPNDGLSDEIGLMNSENQDVSSHFVYLLTNDQNILIEVIRTDVYNFEGSGDGVQRIYGLSFDTEPNLTVGLSIDEITSASCIELSSNFINITKNGCTQNEVASISGIIKSPDGITVPNVMMFLNTGATTTTNAEGRYSFSELPLRQPYTITPSKSGTPNNGVSAQDLAIVINHILGVTSIESKYLIIASDVNGDNNVSVIDLVNILNIIVGNSQEFTIGKSWRFVPSDHDLDAEIFDFVDKRAVLDLQGDINDIDFTAVKLGDASGNADYTK